MIKKLTDENTFLTYQRVPIVLKKGKNAILFDENEKEYIDFTSGIGVSSLGYSNGEWLSAVISQIAKLPHTSNYYYNIPAAKLSEKLIFKAGYKDGRVFFANSGAEANECAIKLARKYSFDKYNTKSRSKILTLKNSFHGRTLATIKATGQEDFHKYFDPFPEGFEYCNIPEFCTKILEFSEKNELCAVMLEYIQGEGGVNVLSLEFIESVYKICREKDILVIADEIQTGIGRTGYFLAGDFYEKKADIVTLAKGLGGGLPIGVCLASSKCAGVLTAGTHGTTFGGNAAVCAGALVVVDKISDNDFLYGVREKFNKITKKLSSCNNSHIKEITGRGLMIGIKTDLDPTSVKNKCAENGLLILTAKDKIRFLPPLTITDEELDKGLLIFLKSLDNF